MIVRCAGIAARSAKSASGPGTGVPPCQTAALASARIAVTAAYSRSARTARKLPSRCTRITPGREGDRVRIDADEGGRRAGRPDDPGMDHAGGADVLDIGRAARDLGGDVDPRKRPADDRVARRVAIGDRLGTGASGSTSGAISPSGRRRPSGAATAPPSIRKPLRSEAEPAPGGGEEQGPHGGGGMPDRGGGILHRVAAGGVASSGVSSVSAVTRRRTRAPAPSSSAATWISRRLDALAEFRLAGHHRDGAVLADPDPGIDLRRLGQAAGQGRPGLARQPDPDEDGAADDQRARVSAVTVFLPWRGQRPGLLPGLPGRLDLCPAARRTAARIRIWVAAAAAQVQPQRGADLGFARMRVSRAAGHGPASPCRRCSSRIAPRSRR